MPQASPLPDSVQLALWYSAWAIGGVSLDDARDAIVGADAGHDVAQIPGEPAPLPLILAFARLRSAGATMAGAALPVPGDPLGLAGPGDFNTAVLDAGEGVVLDGAGLGLVPQRAGSGVVWTCHRAASRSWLPDLAEADTTLREAVIVSANTLADLDVARWNPEVADELMALRLPVELLAPPTTPARALRVLALATRCRGVVELASQSDGAAVTAHAADARRSALKPLDDAARRGLVAASTAGAGR